MTQQKPQPPPQPDQTSPQQSRPKTEWGRKTEEVLEKVSEPVDLVGRRLMGDLWRTFYLTVQDAIALSLLLRIPGLIGHWVIGKDFSSFNACFKENLLSVTPYACFIIVISDFLLWMVLAGRTVARFRADWDELRKSKGGGGHGSSQP